MSIQSDLKRLDAPNRVLEAGKELDEQAAAGLPLSMALSAYVRDWVTRNMGNNRYGR